MSDLILLDEIELVPVLELEPFKFATSERPRPFALGADSPEDWHRYWLDSLADSGITGLTPLRPNSWHVPTRDLTDSEALRKIISVFFGEEGGTESVLDPADTQALYGGLALMSGGELIVEPTCCSDLRNLSDWKAAAGYRELGWTMLWIGHPWLSLRFDGERLVLSEPHESDSPVGRWLVNPDDLHRAVVAAEEELGEFARQLEGVLKDLGAGDRAETVARRLVGFSTS